MFANNLTLFDWPAQSYLASIRKDTKACVPDYVYRMCGCPADQIVRRWCRPRRGGPRGPYWNPAWPKIAKTHIHAFGRCFCGDCVECQTENCRRRAKAVKERLDLGRKGRPVAQTVFTVPPRRRGQILNPKYRDSLRRQAWRILREVAGAEFGTVGTHPVGDQHSDRFHPHFHFLWTGGEGFKGYLTEACLAEMQKCWAQILNVAVADVHHSYAKGKRDAKIYHLCKYVCRPFPGYQEWIGSRPWHGTYPKLPKRTKQPVCPKCRRPFVQIGHASADLYAHYRSGGDVGVPEYMLSMSWTGVGVPDRSPPHV